MVPNDSSTFYYEYFDKRGYLKCIDPRDFLTNRQDKSVATITQEMCTKVHSDLDDDQRVSNFFK